jgi:hypothetical protein
VHFKSVKKIAQSTLEEIETIVGKSKAMLVFEHFKTTEIQE